jgi:hypothetical protein
MPPFFHRFYYFIFVLFHLFYFLLSKEDMLHVTIKRPKSLLACVAIISTLTSKRSRCGSRTVAAAAASCMPPGPPGRTNGSAHREHGRATARRRGQLLQWVDGPTAFHLSPPYLPHVDVQCAKASQHHQPWIPTARATPDSMGAAAGGGACR